MSPLSRRSTRSPAGCSWRGDRVNEVNVVNVRKSATFTLYPQESKGPGERGERCETFFTSRRTRHAISWLMTRDSRLVLPRLISGNLKTPLRFALRSL
jgi:hypothetical protein